MKRARHYLILLLGVLFLAGTVLHAQPQHAKSIYVYPLWSAPYNLDGNGIKLGVFEFGKIPYKNHPEFKNPTAKIVIDAVGSTGLSAHPTQVCGLIVAKGKNPAARGIATKTEVATFVADGSISAFLNEAGLWGWDISNHSYGVLRGWQQIGSDWLWYGTREKLSTNVEGSEDRAFGYYDNFAKLLDELLYNQPTQIPVIASGNHRNLGPTTPGTYYKVLPNGGTDTTTVMHPKNGENGYDVLTSHATAKNAIVVGAVDRFGKLWSRSATGPTDDGRIKPDVVALGNDVVVCSSGGSLTGYDTTDGTSLAAPAVSGSLVLLQQYWKQKYGSKDFLSATARGMLIHTARDLGKSGPDYQFGWGRVNAKEAAKLISSSKSTNGFTIQEKTLSQNGEYVFYVKTTLNARFKATLTWTDPAGIPASLLAGVPPLNNRKKMLVNDLDLRVYPVYNNDDVFDYNVYQPYTLDPTKPSATADNGDNNIDNVEQVSFKAVDLPDNNFYQFNHVYKVVVSHKGGLANAHQDFTVIVTGGKEHLIAPTGVSASSGNSAEEKENSLAASSATVSWDAVPGATRYDMIYRKAGSYSWTAKYNLVGTEGSIPNLEPATYQVKVRARHGLVKSAWSDVTEFYGLTPKAPKYLWKLSVASTSAKVRWSSVSGASQYQVAYVRINSDNQTLGGWRSKVVNETSTTLSFLTPDARYIVYVRSKYNNNLYSEWSKALVFYTTITCSNFGSDDAANGARALPVSEYTHGLLCNGDEEDWFRIENPSSWKKNLKVILYNHPEPFRVSLYRQLKSGGTISLVQGGPTGFGTKSLVLNNADFTKYTYFVQVWAQNPNTDYHNSKQYTVVAFTSSKAYPAVKGSNEPAVTKAVAGSELTTGQRVAVYPNPAREVANVQFNATTVGELCTVTLHDAAGRVLYNWSGETVTGANNVQFKVEELPSGVYFVAVEQGGSRTTSTLHLVR